ncbi:transporter substrate-binding domain-containing protein [Vibrio sp. JC009]|uniref:substrate-binding periplasmic protein n=1 Tax=Vibrio sp. JC009 TaxID=2912314 RepID=UPI0023AF6864|nr:transporter substrate-binding domain-containing protein [Vibrio sp. JC009]WED23539.1 transporter substrate-binding domain-containing protein [Vibrio sp. JC009]
MNKQLKRFALCGVISLFYPTLSHSESVELDLYTDEFPPLQVQVDDEPRGYVIEYIQRLVQEAAKSHPMQIRHVNFVPWKRAMLAVEESENSLLFAISRTELREKKYQWIGEVSPYETTLYRHVDGPKKVASSLKDLKYFRFGAQSGSAFEDLLRELECPDVMTVTYGRRAIKLLSADRIDYAPLVASSFYYRMEQYGYNPDDYVPVLKIDELSKELWLVTGNKTSAEVVSALQSSHTYLQEKGVLKELIAAYQPDSTVMKKYREQKQAERIGH